MSALAMILTVAMVVPGDGPEKVSGEIVQRLDLSGKWEGELRLAFLKGPYSTWPATYQDGKLTAVELRGPEALNLVFIDEGKGMCRCRKAVGPEALGIYKWERDQFFICFREDCKGRPTKFAVEDANTLLILHRVKSHK